MRRGLLFSRRIMWELLRDPLSYIFCVVTPMGMMLLFYVIYVNMPAEAATPMFRPDVLTPGIAFFGFAFVMLFASLLVSRDRDTAFLDRLRATPMRCADFLLGYTLPLLVLGLVQCVLTFSVGGILGATVENGELTFVGCLGSIGALMPALFFMIFLGVFLGSLMSSMAAPGVSSLIVTLAGVMGGVWMPITDLPKLEKVFMFFPFLHMVRLGQGGAVFQVPDLWLNLGVSFGYLFIAACFAMWTFPHMLKKQK